MNDLPSNVTRSKLAELFQQRVKSKQSLGQVDLTVYKTQQRAKAILPNVKVAKYISEQLRYFELFEGSGKWSYAVLSNSFIRPTDYKTIID